MIPDLDTYHSAQVLVKGTQAFPVPREGAGLFLPIKQWGEFG